MLGLKGFDTIFSPIPDWDETELADYLLYNYWQPYNAWILISGFDWHEDIDTEPSALPYFSEGEDGYDKEVSEFKALLKIYHANRNIHRRLSNFWIMSGGGRNSDTPKYFIDWALSKRIIPAWLDWAIENKLYVPTEIDIATIEQVAIIDKPLSTRSENNYLRLIYAFASTIKDFDPTNPNGSAKLIIDDLGVSFIKQKTISDYIKKAYELECKERE